MNDEITSSTSAVALGTNLAATAFSTATRGDQNVNTNEKVIKKFLAAFDFDQTMVSQKSDHAVRELLPPAYRTRDTKEFFRHVQKAGIKPQSVLYKIRNIPEVPGFVELLKTLNMKHGCDLILISASNSVFVEEWIKSHGLQENFLKIFCNPAEFDDTNFLTIKPYHHQTECRLSPVSFCKGKILEDFINEQYLHHNVTYEHVIYVGDGTNDICPVIKLRSQDLACARLGYSLANAFLRGHSVFCKHKFKKILLWENGYDLLKLLEQQINKLTKLNENEQESIAETEIVNTQ